MNDPQKEITRLHEQVSQLYVVVKQLGEYVGCQDIVNLKIPLEPASIIKLSKSSHRNNSYSYNRRSKENNDSGDNLYLLNQRHKDILVDDELVSASVCDQNQNSEIISCDEQVNRLTAQLTAAYYRIASLEEQLLGIRNKMETGNNEFYQCQ